MSSSMSMGQDKNDSANKSDNKPGHISPPMAPDQTDDTQSEKKKVVMGSGTITNRISAGGMAIIYEIWNQELEVSRAVKLLRPDHTQESAERFQTEMKISAKLHHPNIIEIYAVGKWNSLPYIEMERIDGFTLEKVIAHAGSLPLEVCTAVAIMVGRALNYAHNQTYMLYGESYKGIIHRDLKPSNIMITKRGTVKLMDFGIAKPVTASIHTCTDVVIGTLQYLAPEQLEGKEADFRSDVYSLGTVIYEMLTGKQAFPEAGLAKLVPSKLDNTYVPLDQFKMKIPRTVRDIVHKSLRLEPDKRYQSALEFLRALGRVHKKLTYLSPEQVMAKYMQAPSQSKTVVSRKSRTVAKPLLIWGSAAAILCITSMGAIYVYNPGAMGSFKRFTGTISSERIVDHYVLAKDMLAEYANRIQGENDRSDSGDVNYTANRADQRRFHSERDPRSASVTRAAQLSVPETAYSTGVAPLNTPELIQTQTADHQNDSAATDSQTPTADSGLSPLDINEEMREQATSRPSRQATRSPSLIDRLRFEYGVDNLKEIFIAEVEKREYDNALKVWERLSEEEKSGTKARIYRFRALLNSGKKSRAKEVLVSEHINDGEFLLEKAMYYYQTGQQQKAREIVADASRAPVAFMNRTTFRQRLLFTKALCTTATFDDNPSPHTRQKSMEAWFEVKSFLRTSPDHRYFQEADIQIRRISKK